LFSGYAVKPAPAQAFAARPRYDGRMKNDETQPQAEHGSSAEADAQPVSDTIDQNISDMARLQEAELAHMSVSERRLERASRKAAHPGYVVGLLVVVALWIAFNLTLGVRAFDPPPFQFLQGALTFIAMLTATVVLAGQSRQTKLAEQRAHLDLQINLLTEQKVTKLIHLIEELRADLPVVRERSDPHVSALKEPTDAARVVSALKRAGLTSESQDTKERKGTEPGKP
jgi:uncharacterized membrane protein